MKQQVLFSSKDKSKKIKCHLLQILFGALTVIVIVSSRTNDDTELIQRHRRRTKAQTVLRIEAFASTD